MASARRRDAPDRVTANPDPAWVTQQARNAAMELNDRGVSVRLLLRDHDAKFSRGFDDVFRSEGGQVLRTPIRAPKANASAERCVQTMRAECLGWTLVLGRRHLLRLLCAYVRHYNQQRPHRSLALAVPEAGKPQSPQVNPGEVRRRDVLGGLIMSITRLQHDEPRFPRPTGRRYLRNHRRFQLGGSPEVGWLLPARRHPPDLVVDEDR